MTKYHKIVVAGNMLVEAAREFRDAQDDMNYIKCILLSGAADMILAPLIDELSPDPSRKRSSHQILARMTVGLENMLRSKTGEQPMSEEEAAKKIKESVAFSRKIYNSLKHAGGRQGTRKAIDDLDFEADLRSEALLLMEAALDDFKRIPTSKFSGLYAQFSEEVIDLLASQGFL